MPIPKPKKAEKKTEYLSRCMANPTMKREYKQREQRFAVCQTEYDKRDK